MNTTPTNEPTFQDEYDFPSKVRLQYGKFTRFRVMKTGDTYQTGREKLNIYFCDMKSDDPIAAHECMELTSKKTGKPYYVCKKTALDDDKEDDDKAPSF